MPGGAHENMKAWSPEEDTLIIAMHESEGPKWSKIVQRLPGRTVSSVRNRWQRIEKGRKLREAGVELDAHLGDRLLVAIVGPDEGELHERHVRRRVARPRVGVEVDAPQRRAEKPVGHDDLKLAQEARLKPRRRQP